MQGNFLKRLAILSWISLALLTVCAALDAYAYWVVSKYPQFIIRWFGPSFFGMNFIKFLRYITIAISLSWLSSFLLLVRIARIRRANNLLNRNLHNLERSRVENGSGEEPLATTPMHSRFSEPGSAELINGNASPAAQISSTPDDAPPDQN